MALGEESRSTKEVRHTKNLNVIRHRKNKRTDWTPTQTVGVVDFAQAPTATGYGNSSGTLKPQYDRAESRTSRFLCKHDKCLHSVLWRNT